MTYYPDGTERSTGRATATEPIVYQGNKAVVTGASDQPVTIGAIYTVFDLEDRPDQALSKITVSPGQSVKFHNGGSLSNPVRSNAKQIGGLYDVVVYKADGRTYGDVFNGTGNRFMIPSGGEAIVTVAGNAPVLFEYTDDFSVVDSQEPAYLRVTLNKGRATPSPILVRNRKGSETMLPAVRVGCLIIRFTTQMEQSPVVGQQSHSNRRSWAVKKL